MKSKEVKEKYFVNDDNFAKAIKNGLIIFKNIENGVDFIKNQKQSFEILCEEYSQYIGQSYNTAINYVKQYSNEIFAEIKIRPMDDGVIQLRYYITI